MVSRVIFHSFFFYRVLDLLGLNLDVRLFQARMNVAVIGPMDVVERLGRILKASGLHYFAGLNNKRADYSLKLISYLTKFF